MKHAETKMERSKPIPLHTFYNGKNFSADFKCPNCGRTIKKNLNFLGGHSIFCNGEKTSTK